MVGLYGVFVSRERVCVCVKWPGSFSLSFFLSCCHVLDVCLETFIINHILARMVSGIAAAAAASTAKRSKQTSIGVLAFGKRAGGK